MNSTRAIDLLPGSDASPRSAGRLRTSFPVLAKLVLVLSPTIVAAFYYFAIAAPRYVSEAQFVVRTAAKPMSLGSFGTILEMTGLSRVGDDVYAVQSFMTSRAAVIKLIETIDLKSIYGRPEADLLSGFPSVFFGSTIEEFHRYLGWMIRTTYSTTTGIVTLKVNAFRSDDAKLVSDSLRTLAEEQVNKMNRRIQEDAIRTATADVDTYKQRLIDAQVALTRFRNSELIIDAAGSSLIVMELIARLSAELTGLEAQIRETSASAPNSPSLQVLKRRAEAIEVQINSERSKIADNQGGLAQKLAQYERLMLDNEFAKTALTVAEKSLEAARAEGRRQQLYIEYVVEPNLPDYPMEPRRLYMLWTVGSLNIVFVLVSWLIYSGIRQHSFEKG